MMIDQHYSPTGAMAHDRSYYRITGGQPLRGTVKASGAKNSVTKLFVATLLSEEPSVLTNVPRMVETDVVLSMMADLGTKVEWLDDDTEGTGLRSRRWLPPPWRPEGALRWQGPSKNMW